MPGEDHEVHQRTRIGDEFRWGCWNVPRTRANIKVKAGFRLIEEERGHYAGEQLFKTINDFGSLTCKNDISLKDPNCRGCCNVGQGEINSERIRNLGT